MAGTLTISTLSDGTNSTSSTNCIQGSAKAWVNFNGATGVKNASYNVSSVTTVTTGVFTINFTNALADTNYAWTASAGIDNSNQQDFVSSPTSTAISTWKQTGSLRLQNVYANVSTDRSANDFSVAVFR